jgi:hypothetical protein
MAKNSPQQVARWTMVNETGSIDATEPVDIIDKFL